MKRSYNGLRHAILKVEDVSNRPGVAVGPDMRTVVPIDELRRDPYVDAGTLNAALKNVSNAEIATHLPYINAVTTFVGERAISGDHEQRTNAR